MNRNSALGWVPIFLVFWALALYAHLDFGAYISKIALHGFSALDFANTILFPDNFIRDYPGGAWLTGKSLISWIYPGLQYLGIPSESTYVFLVACEIAVLVYGAAHLARTLFTNLPTVGLLALAVVFTLSWIRYCDLGRVSSPFFHGQFYGYADGLRLLAISYFLRGQHLVSSFVLAIGMVIHPLKILFGLAFIGGGALVECRKFSQLRNFWPYLVFCIFAGLWMWLWLGIGSGNQGISSEDFFRYSPLLNSHWYPQDLGILDSRHGDYMTPFLGAVLVSMAILIRSEITNPLRDQLMLGILTILVLTFFGLWIAWNEVSATLVKACMQRASGLALSVATILLVAQTVRDIFGERSWFAAHGIVAVALAFYSTIVWPFLIALSYTVSVLADSNLQTRFPMLCGFLLILLLVVIGYEVGLYFQDFQDDRYWLRQIVPFVLMLIISAVVTAVLKLFPAFKNFTRSIFFIPTLLVALLASGAYGWATKFKVYSPNRIERGLQYKDVQIWARDHSDIDDLFFLDPCHAYGWRDFSRRSSFGSIHEWYKTGWLYTGNRDAFIEGLERGKRLGINIDEIAPPGDLPVPKSMFTDICTVARSNFYLESGEIVKRIATDYQIDFVVMDKSQASAYGSIPSWKVSYENKYYVVLTPPVK